MSAKGKPVSLALQGGGTHGAFAWGALDRLLEDGALDIRAVSASSGGALTAVILADGLLRDGADGAREHLRAFWRKVSVAASMLPIRTTLMDKFLSNVGIDLSPSSIALDYFTKLFSPYQFNLFDLNPLRAIIDEMVDFETLQEQRRLQLFINATAVKTGRGRLFTGKDVTLDAVMAAACLPFIFKTVMIDGEPYWDGGYSGNPPLYPLIESAYAPRDVILVQSAPLTADDAPTLAADILDRATEISFNSALLGELRAAALYNKHATPEAALRLHMIESSEMLASLSRASKINADWEFLNYLHDLGTQAADDFLSQRAGGVGTQSTLDLTALLA